MTVRDAHSIAALGDIAAVRHAISSAAPGRDVARLLLQAVEAQYAADMDRCTSVFRVALRASNAAERPYVADLFVPILCMHHRLEEAREFIASIEEIPKALSGLFRSMEAVIAAMAKERPTDEGLDSVAIAGDDLTRARILQRTAYAHFYYARYEAAIDASRKAARLLERLGAHRSAAAAISIAYTIHHTVTADAEEAYRTAKLVATFARKAHDRSFEMAGLVAQYEIAAEFGEATVVARLKAAINEAALPTQYEERFARGIADTLPYGWAGDFDAFHANAALLRTIPGMTRPSLALASALRGIAEAAMRDFDAARRTSRNALGLASFSSAHESSFDLRYRRLARALAASTCLLIGDTVRGRRALAASAFRHEEIAAIVAVVDGADWRTAQRRVRGYARLVSVARSEMTDRGPSPLTTAEYDVLRLLADGKSAPEVALVLGRSVHTVRAHTRRIIEKFDVNGRGSAISHARKTGLLR